VGRDASNQGKGGRGKLNMPFGVLTFTTDEGIGPVELARALEQRGFDSLFLAEHTHIPVDAKTPYPMGGSTTAPWIRSWR